MVFRQMIALIFFAALIAVLTGCSGGDDVKGNKGQEGQKQQEQTGEQEQKEQPEAQNRVAPEPANLVFYSIAGFTQEAFDER